MLLQGKRIVVTGGGSGMGAATVRAYAREGASVVSLDRDEEQGRRVASETEGDVTFLRCDVSDRLDVDAAFDAALERLGGLDVLAHAAGIWRRLLAADADETVWDQLLAVNLKGTLYTNWAAQRAMRESGGGSIINFGSGTGIDTGGDAVAYGVSKAAVHSWTRSISREWGQWGIRANAVAPAIATHMAALAVATRRELLSPEEAAERERRFAARAPSGVPLGDPDRDFAPVMVFLAGDGSR